MAVAWIGNREARLEKAVAEAARVLAASRCPVIIMDTDVHGARAAVALADRIGAAVDLAEGGATMREAAQLADRGMMTVAPGEVRRRADMLVLVGDVPKAQSQLVEELMTTTPDLNGGKKRALFVIGKKGKLAAVNLTSAKGGVSATLAGLRARLAGRPASASIKNIESFVSSLSDATFPVFVWSGLSGDALALDMLQGLVADLNKTRRASTLHLPASENGWASVLACGWSSGFPPRTGFARGRPEHDPWQYDAARMLEQGEVDLVLTVAGSRSANRVTIASHDENLLDAPISIVIGEPAIDHETVTYRGKLGTLGAVPASKPSGLPSAAAILRMIIDIHDGAAV